MLSTDYCPYCGKEIGDKAPIMLDRCYYDCDGWKGTFEGIKAKLLKKAGGMPEQITPPRYDQEYHDAMAVMDAEDAMILTNPPAADPRQSAAAKSPLY